VHPRTSVLFPGFTVYCSSNSANFINVFFTVNGGPEQMQSVASPTPELRDQPDPLPLNP
jgi:hypothetical protein